jgi:hypothetical protein
MFEAFKVMGTERVQLAVVGCGTVNMARSFASAHHFEVACGRAGARVAASPERPQSDNRMIFVDPSREVYAKMGLMYGMPKITSCADFCGDCLYGMLLLLPPPPPVVTNAIDTQNACARRHCARAVARCHQVLVHLLGRRPRPAGRRICHPARRRARVCGEHISAAAARQSRLSARARVRSTSSEIRAITPIRGA